VSVQYLKRSISKVDLEYFQEDARPLVEDGARTVGLSRVGVLAPESGDLAPLRASNISIAAVRAIYS